MKIQKKNWGGGGGGRWGGGGGVGLGGGSGWMSSQVKSDFIQY